MSFEIAILQSFLSKFFQFGANDALSPIVDGVDDFLDKLILIGAIVGGIIILLVIAWVISLIAGSKR